MMNSLVKSCKKLRHYTTKISVSQYFDLALLPSILLFGYFYYPLKDVGPNLSVWQSLFGFKPYSGGLTRALCSFTRGEFVEAYRYNPLIYPVLGIMMIVWLIAVFKCVRVLTRSSIDYID